MAHLRSRLAIAGAGALSLLAAGCSSGSGGGSGAGQSAGSPGGTTVAVEHVSGGTVLVDSSGRTLYTSDQERAAGKVLCTSAGCTNVWLPLDIAPGQRPTGPAAVAKQLGTVQRPDGSRQVTLRGVPLYTFSFDHSKGDMSGNGEQDSFAGTHFTWHAAGPAGAVQGPTAAPSTSGYNY